MIEELGESQPWTVNLKINLFSSGSTSQTEQNPECKIEANITDALTDDQDDGANFRSASADFKIQSVSESGSDEIDFDCVNDDDSDENFYEDSEAYNVENSDKIKYEISDKNKVENSDKNNVENFEPKNDYDENSFVQIDEEEVYDMLKDCKLNPSADSKLTPSLDWKLKQKTVLRDHFVWLSHIHKTPLQMQACYLFTSQLFFTTSSNCSLTLKERLLSNSVTLSNL